MSWKTALMEFNQREFPARELNGLMGVYEQQQSVILNGSEDEIKELKDGKIVSVFKDSCSHKMDKKSHNAIEKRVPNIFSIEGYPVDVWEKYCWECKKVFETGMVIFNNELNVCKVKKQTTKDYASNNLDIFGS